MVMLRTLLVVGMLAFAGQIGQAGVVVNAVDDDGSADPLISEEDALAQLRRAAPDLLVPLDLRAPQEACKAAQTPRTHAILVGVSDPLGGVLHALKGPANDISILENALQSHGLAAERTHVLLDQGATRAALAEVVQAVLDDIRCDDSVIVYFGGHALNGENARALLEKNDLAVPGSLRKRLDAAAPFFLLTPEGPEQVSLIGARAMSRALVLLRNTGADVTVLLDTMHADTAQFHQRHRALEPDATWSRIVAADPPDQPSDEDTVLMPHAGELTALYAVQGDSYSVEMALPKGDPDAKTYGYFTFKFTASLMSEAGLSPRRLASALADDQSEWGRDFRHLLESTAPDKSIIAEKRVLRRGDSIRILEPHPTRGAVALDSQMLNLRGQVVWDEKPIMVMVNGQLAEFNAQGDFSHSLEVSPSLTKLDVVALTADNTTHTQSFDVSVPAESRALLGNGTRYAVLIANQTYGDQTGMASLATPFADVDAIAAELTGRYGFVTRATTPDGRDISLVLKDGSKSAIETLLFDVSRFAGSDDTVLIYYAGHGAYEEQTGNAYWIPSDARHQMPPSFLSMHPVRDNLKRLNAGNVLLVADSCYAGAFRSGGTPASEPVPDRRRALRKMVEKRSRVLITSGDVEPVLDQGGQGHSIFARAFLTGLREMEPDAFSARELFADYIYHQVYGAAQQEPQHRALRDAGHEGGGFVFARDGAGQP